MNYNYTMYISSLITKDSKEVAICIQALNKIDANVLLGIKNEIKSYMDKTQALSGNIQFRQINILDSHNVSRRFSSCFILTYNNDYSKVIDANIVSFVEI